MNSKTKSFTIFAIVAATVTAQKYPKSRQQPHPVFVTTSARKLSRHNGEII
jgi:hypothetical protein